MQIVKVMDMQTILLIEDHQKLRQMAATWLKGLFPEINILQAGTGEEGIELARLYKPSVTVVDINLPRIDGLQVTRLIHSDLPDSAVIILTILEGTDYKVNALKAGAHYYINKQNMYAELPDVLCSILKCKSINDFK